MTTYFVGPGGSNGQNGLTWGNRWLTIAYAESQSSAGDVIYIGPGEYREAVTFSVQTGTSGNPITYIGDTTGAYTDGLGGIVRWTRANAGNTSASGAWFTFDTSAEYITIRGIHFDSRSSQNRINVSDVAGGNITFEDCVFQEKIVFPSNELVQAFTTVAAAMNGPITFRRCLFQGGYSAIDFTGPTTGGAPYANYTGSVIENCIFMGGVNHILSNFSYGWAVRNCTFMRCTGVACPGGSASGTTCYNSVFLYCDYAFSSNNLVENHNVLGGAANAYLSGPTPGGSTVDRAIGFATPLMIDGIVWPLNPFEYASWSGMYSESGGQSPIPEDDFFGIARPTATGKRTKGAIQFCTPEQETSTVYGDETESIKFKDAMWYQFFIPIPSTTMTIEVAVYRQANYAGLAPSMTIKQPGQSDIVVSDSGASGQWNLLQKTFSPSGTPGYVVLEIRSDNTATSGSYATFFGGIEIK